MDNKDACIGYSLRFFKKASDLDYPLGNDFFSFITFGNFDGAKIYPIESIDEFSKNRVEINYTDESRYCAHCERQILNLIKIEKTNQDIFLNNEMPIIVVFMMTSYENKEIIKTEKLKEVLNKEQTDKSFTYEIFNVLSVEDRAIIFRAFAISRIFDLINKIQSIENACVNFYSISGVFLDHKEKWEESPDKLNAFIRFHLRPSGEHDGFFNTLKKEKLFSDIGLNFFQTMGKYDAFVKPTIKDTADLIGLFEEKGVLNPCENTRSVFISSNTTFLSLVSPKVCGMSVVEKTKDLKYLWKDILKTTGKITSEMIKRAAVVLAERVHLLKHSVFSHKYFEEIYKFTSKYLDALTKMPFDDSDHRQKILNQIVIINLFIDNIYSYGFRDFESPQKDVRIVIDAGKVLLAYKKFADELLSTIETVSLIVPNVNEIIHKESMQEYKFFIARIPEQSIFDINTNLFLIGHEIGHDFENESDYFSAYQVFIKYWFVYYVCNDKYSDMVLLDSLYTSLKTTNFEFEKDKTLFENVETTISKFQEKIKTFIGLENVRRGIKKIEKLESFEVNMRELHKKHSKKFNDFSNAYVEVYADIFVIQTLDLDSFKDAFKEYFLLLSKSFTDGESSLTVSFCIRLLSVYLWFYFDEFEKINDTHDKKDKKMGKRSFIEEFQKRINSFCDNATGKHCRYVADKMFCKKNDHTCDYAYDDYLVQAHIICKIIKDKVCLPKTNEQIAKTFKTVHQYNSKNICDEDYHEYLRALNVFLGFAE